MLVRFVTVDDEILQEIFRNGIKNVKTEGWKREVKEETQEIRLVHFMENYKLCLYEILHDTV